MMVPSLQAMLAGALGITALMLAIVGTYGTVSYAATQRRHDMALCVALGGRKLDLLRLLARSGLWQAIGGAGVGVAMAFALTRAIRVLLFGTSSIDALSIVAVPLLVLAMTFLAGVVALKRVTPSSVSEALRGN